MIDITANMISPPNYEVIYLEDTHPFYTDIFPKHTAFAKELLVQGGTKQLKIHTLRHFIRTGGVPFLYLSFSQ